MTLHHCIKCKRVLPLTEERVVQFALFRPQPRPADTIDGPAEEHWCIPCYRERARSDAKRVGSVVVTLGGGHLDACNPRQREALGRALEDLSRPRSDPE